MYIQHNVYSFNKPLSKPLSKLLIIVMYDSNLSPTLFQICFLNYALLDTNIHCLEIQEIENYWEDSQITQLLFVFLSHSRFFTLIFVLKRHSQYSIQHLFVLNNIVNLVSCLEGILNRSLKKTYVWEIITSLLLLLATTVVLYFIYCCNFTCIVNH